MQQIVDFLLKHPDTAYERGVLGFRNNIFGPVLPLILLLVFFLAFLSYRSVKHTGLKNQCILASLRGATFAIILILLLQPILIVPTVLPNQSFVAMLYDTSKSMSIRDSPEKLTRLERVLSNVRSEEGRFYSRLEAKFKVRNYEFSSSLERIDWPPVLVGEGTKTILERAISGADADLRDVPLSGVVLISDGADNGSKDMQGVLANLRSRNIPVYTVGVGSEKLAKDVNLTSVFAAHRALEGEAIAADVAIRSRGYPGTRATLSVEEGGRTVATDVIHLGSDDEVVNKRVSITPQGKGVHHYTFKISPLPGEILLENNSREVLVRVSDDAPRILYMEGEPRWEYKFLRRGLADDQTIRLSTILRTAKNQYLRQGIQDSTQLLEGFPAKKSELFDYKGIILGSLEASYFTADQLRLIEEFVDQRGGGFLMIGGSRSFAEGGFQGTPIAKLLPIEMQPASESVLSKPAVLRPVLTEYGRIHPLTRLVPSENENRRLWESLPPVTFTNNLSRIKAGATELVRGISESGKDFQVLLAFQRYGRGRSLALGSDSTWHWRMEVPHEQDPHEVFWKQVLRWMVSNTPNRVEASTDRAFVSPGETVEITAEVFNREFISLNRASVSARVHTPSGSEEEVELNWIISEDGFHSGTFVPQEKGLYKVKVTADDGTDITIGQTQFFAGESRVEFHEPTQNRRLLEAIARETGGKYYTLDTLQLLPEEIRFIKNEASRSEELDLWDLPLNFMLICLFLTAEWFVRNRLKLV